MTTYYDILGVRPTASADEIKAAFRRLARKFHPDSTPGADPAVRRSLEDKFKEIQEAYDTLRDKDKRAEYDEMLAMLNSGEYYEPPPPPPPPRPMARKRRNWKQYSGVPIAIMYLIGVIITKGELFNELTKPPWWGATWAPIARPDTSEAARAEARSATQNSSPQPNSSNAVVLNNTTDASGWVAFIRISREGKLHSDLGWAFEQKGDFRNASAEYEAAMRLNPNDLFSRAGLNRINGKMAVQPPASKALASQVSTPKNERPSISGSMPLVSVLVAGPITSWSGTHNPIAEAPHPPAVFTIGASKADVRRIQGTPTSVTDAKWGYGPSSVYFSNERVVGWQIDSNAPLKVKLLPTGQVDGNRGYFTVGSTKDEVLAVQGTPTVLTDPIWGYGPSSVYFRDGQVVSWVNRSDIPLRVRTPGPEAHASLGWDLGQKGDGDGAIAEYREALRLNPNNDLAHANLGWVLREKGDWDGAIAEYREKLRLNPDSGNAHYLLGRLLERKGNYDEALGEYRAAHELDPRNPAYRDAYERLLRQVNH